MNLLHRFALIAAVLAISPGEAVFGQQTEYGILGKVLEESTGLPLPGVAVWASESGKGTVTDIKGDFSFTFNTFPISLCFRHLGYFDDTVRIENKEIYKRYFEGTRARVSLRQNPFLIEEVVIAASGVAVRMFEEEPYAIMDYVIEGNRFYALGYRNYNPMKSEIFIGDPYGRLLFAVSVQKAQEIYQDCKGAVYALTKDSAYILNNLNDSLDMAPVSDAVFFETKVKPIAALNDPWYILFDQSKNGQYQDYYLGNYETGKNELFYRVGDEKQEQGFVNVNKQIRQEFIAEFAKSDYSSGELRAMHERQAKLLNRINTDFRPVRSALFQMQDTALLFDFDHGVVNCISISGELLWRTRIQIDLNRDFTGKVHHDKSTNRFFLEFLNVQSSYLIEINTLTGKSISNISIRQYRHVDHISVQNNKIYFLYQPDSGDRGKRLFYINL